MKTLIFNGSPRKNGDTAKLIGLLTQNVKGECRVVNAYTCGISPCTDCRFCWKNPGCSIDDGMQSLYEEIRECDNILIASPVYFSELTGPLLSVASRLQTFFCARIFRHETPIPKSKRGAILLLGGGDGRMETAVQTARTLLRQMNAVDVLNPVTYHNTNQRPATETVDMSGIVDFFNRKG